MTGARAARGALIDCMSANDSATTHVMSGTRPKRALVLGCGGVAGAAWTVATLSELERVLGLDAREADILIGTSAGALAAALLGAGVSVARLVKSQRGELADDCWDHARDWGSGVPPTPRFVSRPRS